jgi:hypothetical protein
MCSKPESLITDFQFRAYRSVDFLSHSDFVSSVDNRSYYKKFVRQAVVFHYGIHRLAWPSKRELDSNAFRLLSPSLNTGPNYHPVSVNDHRGALIGFDHSSVARVIKKESLHSRRDQRILQQIHSRERFGV